MMKIEFHLNEAMATLTIKYPQRVNYEKLKKLFIKTLSGGKNWLELNDDVIRVPDPIWSTITDVGQKVEWSDDFILEIVNGGGYIHEDMEKLIKDIRYYVYP